MRSIHVLLVGALVLSAWGAQASVTAVVTSSTATTSFQNGLGSTYSGAQIMGNDGGTSLGSGATFASTSNISQNLIEFQNGNASAGAYASVTSQTAVNVTFTNDTGHRVVPTLVSQIIPAGLGVYVGDGSNAACSLSSLTGCGAGAASTFQSFSPSADFGPPGTVLAGATVDFRILENGQTFYDIAASVTLNYDPITGTNFVVSNVGQVASLLNNFDLATGADGVGDLGYTWDATDLTVTFPQQAVLKKNQSATVSYVTTVSTFTSADCQADADCLIAYGSFGDPIGGGGGIQPGGGPSADFVRFDGPDGGVDMGGGSDGAGSGGGGLSFDTETFAYPVFSGDGLVLTLDSIAAPEPRSWLMMIIGAGMIGMAARRRRARPMRARRPGFAAA